MNNYELSNWLDYMQNSLHISPWVMLTILTYFFVMCCYGALIICIWRTFSLDLADKQDILADKYNNPLSFYDGTHELTRKNIAKAMCYANLSYHTYWNAVIKCRYRLCLHKCPRPYFHVNHFKESWNIFSPFSKICMIYSLAFIWGYPLFLIIILLRMYLYRDKLC